jgi:hypothetical protein
MLLELDISVYVKTSDNLDRAAERIFGVLGTAAERASDPEWGGDHYVGKGLGFRGYLFGNTGDMLDPEFEKYSVGLEIMSNFWCVELDAVDLEGPLSEYYARDLAYELNIETATMVLLETSEEGEIFQLRAFRRNPQYRVDAGPTIPKVFVIEEREVVIPFEDEEDDGNNLDETDEPVE